MRSFTLSVLVLCVCSSGATAQPLTHIRIETPNAPSIAEHLERAGFDVLEGSVTSSTLDVIAFDTSLETLRGWGFEFEIIAVSRPFREIQAERQEPGRAPPPGYPDLNQIIAEMNAAAAAYPAICQVVDLTATYGTPVTFEGRHLFAVKISDNVTQDEDEPVQMVVSNHHARETVTPVIALYAIEQFTTQYGTDPTITALVDEYEIWIAPTWNPDGYTYVFEVNNMWRKNRRVFATGTGVDQNRNYPFGWNGACSGSTSPSSETYKGPSPASEAETQTMIAWSQERRFTKVLDFHSSGRETLYGYDSSCPPSHPHTSFLQQEAIAISQASGYGGSVRGPSAEGEHYHWQLAMLGTHAYLTETALEFQPSYASAQAEAAMVFPSVIHQMQRPISLYGHVTGAGGTPVVATITSPDINFQRGEENASGARFGRYHAFLPAGSYTFVFTAAGWAPQTFNNVLILAGQATQLDVIFGPAPPIAQGASLSTAISIPVAVVLVATDDGLPDPPAAMTTVITSLPANGDLTDPGSGLITAVPHTLAAGGNLVDYQPALGYDGPDSFQFVANDGGVPPEGGDSNIATISITVGGLPWDPVAYNVGWSTAVSTPGDVTLSASDPNGDPLTYVIESLPAAGSLSDPGAGAIVSVPYTLVGGANVVTYTPPAGQPLQEGFDFSVADATAGSNVATVSVTVGGPQWDPVAYNVQWGTGLSLPTDVTLSASDPNGDPLTYVIESLPAVGSLSDPGAGAIGGVPYTLVAGSNIVTYHPPYGQALSVAFDFSAYDATAGSNVATVTVDVGVPHAVYDFPLDTDPGWSVEGAWAFGQPTGGGSHAGDPTSGYTGPNVYGYNLSGDYTSDMPVYNLTTPALDFTHISNAELRFQRWLGVEGGFDYARIELSTNGADWTMLWQNDFNTLDESSWAPHTYDISALADGAATVYIRWGMGTTDQSNEYHGWNLDDIIIWGLDSTPVPPPCGDLVFTPGDVNLDGSVNGADVETFSEMLLNAGGNWTAEQLCAADFTGEGVVDPQDTVLFVNALVSP